MAKPKDKSQIKRGAGRPKGAITEASRKLHAIRQAAISAGITPLEVMLKAMHDALEAGGPAAAVPFAEKVAPYLHPKLASVESKNTNDTTVRTISSEPESAAEWEARYGSGVASSAGAAKGAH